GLPLAPDPEPLLDPDDPPPSIVGSPRDGEEVDPPQAAARAEANAKTGMQESDVRMANAVMAPRRRGRGLHRVLPRWQEIAVKARGDQARLHRVERGNRVGGHGSAETVPPWSHQRRAPSLARPSIDSTAGVTAATSPPSRATVRTRYPWST